MCPRSTGNYEVPSVRDYPRVARLCARVERLERALIDSLVLRYAPTVDRAARHLLI